MTDPTMYERGFAEARLRSSRPWEYGRFPVDRDYARHKARTERRRDPSRAFWLGYARGYGSWTTDQPREER